MKTIASLCALFCATRILAADAKLEFTLSVSPVEWKVTNGEVASPVLILWKVKNVDGEPVVLPIGSSTILELVDDQGRKVPGGESSDGIVPLSYQDYRRIKAGWSSYLAGDWGVYRENGDLYLGGATSRGGWVRYGPLHAGKFTLRATLKQRVSLRITQKGYGRAESFGWDISQAPRLRL